MKITPGWQPFPAWRTCRSGYRHEEAPGRLPLLVDGQGLPQNMKGSGMISVVEEVDEFTNWLCKWRVTRRTWLLLGLFPVMTVTRWQRVPATSKGVAG